jgi:hypothetical protein
MSKKAGLRSPQKWRLDCSNRSVPEVPVEHFQCLEMVCVSWSGDSGNSSCDCAILLEIWNSGAKLHTDVAIPTDSIVAIAGPSGAIKAKVSACAPEGYGFLVEVAVEPSQRWFPNSYQPSHLIGRSSP